jgi:hypothetical protein
MGALRASGGGGTLTGANCSSGAILNITFFTPFNFSAGTFAAGNQYAATWTPDARTGQSAGTNWEVGGTRGSGTLTIATVESNRISGSFSFEMTPGPGSPGTGTKSVQGNFNLSFAENRIC